MIKKVKKIIKIFSILILLCLALVIMGIGYLAITEFKPASEMNIISNNRVTSLNEIDTNKSLTLLSYNIGYGCLGWQQDFFMDGGKMVRPDRKSVEDNLSGILSELKDYKADFYLLQEVDENSHRSYNINEVDYLGNNLNLNTSLAYNFKCEFVPFPIPPIGKVASGLLTMSNFVAKSSTRISLPVPFKWPVRMANLKRCLLVNRYKLKDNKHELVLVNLHLEAYDNGEGKAQQSKMLFDFLANEARRGNYVIAGGDFNQLLPDAPIIKVKDPSFWQPPKLNVDGLSNDFKFALDKKSYTNRLNNIILKDNEDKAQYYSLDGFLLSNNIDVSEVKALNTQFKYADHLPIKLVVNFK